MFRFYNSERADTAAPSLDPDCRASKIFPSVERGHSLQSSRVLQVGEQHFDLSPLETLWQPNSCPTVFSKLGDDAIRNPMRHARSFLVRFRFPVVPSHRSAHFYRHICLRFGTRVLNKSSCKINSAYVYRHFGYSYSPRGQHVAVGCQVIVCGLVLLMHFDRTDLPRLSQYCALTHLKARHLARTIVVRSSIMHSSHDLLFVPELVARQH
jgi:hypothetical protein